MDAQLKKGILEMCVLYQLREQEKYGYEIMKQITVVFPDVYDGSIYSILRRLNSEGYTEAYMKDVPSGGPSRKYYRITDSGISYLDETIMEWHNLMKRVKTLGI